MYAEKNVYFYNVFKILATIQLSEVLSTLTLEYKKWSIEQNTLTDFVSAGMF